jgi:hypothetical protein
MAEREGVREDHSTKLFSVIGTWYQIFPFLWKRGGSSKLPAAMDNSLCNRGRKANPSWGERQASSAA